VLSRPADPLVVDGLAVRFGRRTALDDLTLHAKPAGLTAVLGPNGAGKTTLIRCCTGLLRPAAGSIRVLGDAPGSASVASRVGLMPQTTGAWSGIKAGELLNYLGGLYAHPLDIKALIDRLGMGAYAATPYRRLSGGQQQTVNLAAALIGRPAIVFLDEPTAGLDPHARRVTWQLLRDVRAAGVTIVLTTHAMDEAEALADSIYILDRGRVAVSGTVAELTSSGQNLEGVYLAHTQAPVSP
jgi:ABC-2 type transport system ATP-binding protein